VRDSVDEGLPGGKVGVITSDTVDPDTVPVRVPLKVVEAYFPVTDEPSCEMVNWMAHAVALPGAHVVPDQVPATSAVDGAVGVELQLVASATVKATAANLTRCMLASLLQQQSQATPARRQLLLNRS
jgi:hypothetical protein